MSSPGATPFLSLPPEEQAVHPSVPPTDGHARDLGAMLAPIHRLSAGGTARGIGRPLKGHSAKAGWSSSILSWRIARSAGIVSLGPRPAVSAAPHRRRPNCGGRGLQPERPFYGFWVHRRDDGDCCDRPKRIVRHNRSHRTGQYVVVDDMASTGVQLACNGVMSSLGLRHPVRDLTESMISSSLEAPSLTTRADEIATIRVSQGGAALLLEQLRLAARHSAGAITTRTGRRSPDSQSRPASKMSAGRSSAGECLGAPSAGMAEIARIGATIAINCE